MSGSTIGGFVGGAIGFMWGGPAGAQWGFMIGSAVGGYVDPQKIEGPRLTDAQTQTSNEGVPRTIVYGTAAVAGNLIQCGPLVEHKKTERASKGGPKTTTYTYTRTIAIRISEAAPLGGTMRLVRVWDADKLVADFSPANTIPADTAAFASKLTFYSGGETQLPDPSLEALPAANGGGVGNVPSYRGTCYAVLTDLDCTDRQGAVPQYRWEVASDATEVPFVDPGIEAGRLAKFVNAHDPRGDSEDSYTYSAYWVDGFAGGHASPTYNTLQEVFDWVKTASGIRPRYYIGYRGSSARDVGTYTSSSGSFDQTVAQPDVSDLTSVMMLYQWFAPDDGVGYQDIPFSIATATGSAIHGDRTGFLYTRNDPGNDGLWNGVWLNNFAYLGFALYPLCIEVKPKLIIDRVPEGSIPIPDVADYWLTQDGLIVPAAPYTNVSGTFKVLTDGWSSGSDPNNKYVAKWQGPAVQSGNPNYSSSSFWTSAYNAAVAAGTMPAGMTYNSGGTGSVTTTYPQVVSTAYSRGASSNTKVIPGSIALSQIVADLCDRAGVASDQVDVSALAGIEVRGYPIARQTSAAEAIRPLQDVFDFDMPEWGNSGDSTTKLRAVLRGGAIKVTVTDDDLVDNDEDDDGTRAQQVEFPRKVTLTFADPDANYEPASQPAERTTENVRALGEQQISTSVVLSRDEAAVIVDKLLKRLWEEANGRITRELPEEFSRYTSSDPVSYAGKRWRIEKVERAEGTSRWDMVRDRASNTTSTAAGSPAPTPTPPVSSTRGPTMFAAMNLPRLRSQDTTPGMYIGVAGLLPGWAGCDLYLSVDDGVTEQLVGTFLDAATMGTLSADLAAAGATASVSLYGGELDSATVDQLLARQNAAAVTTAEVSEILQFQTATDTGDKAYDLTDLSHGVLGTAAAQHYAGDSFVLLDGAVNFIPLDISLAGKPLIFRPVSIGTAPANNATYTVTFKPKFTGPQVVEAYTDDAGNVYTDDAGNNYYYEVPSP